MCIYHDIVSLFSSDCTLVHSAEDFESVEKKFKLGSIVIPEEDKLKQYLVQLRKADTPTIYINIDSSEEDITFVRDGDFDKFRSEIIVAMGGLEMDTDIFLKIVVRKKLEYGKLSIYSVEDVDSYLSGFSTSELIAFFSETIRANGTVVFSLSGAIVPAVSSVFAFAEENEANIPPFTNESAARDTRLKNIRLSTHATLLSDKSLVPEDFEFLPRPVSILSTVFDRLSFTMTVIALFDVTSLKDDTLTFRLNGYKGIDGSVDLSVIPFGNYLDEYRKIYHWVYGTGNINDKLGLARNIISLHLNPAHDLSFNGNMFNSILSAYKVYEKQNIKQYIEIRNKLSDQLIDYNKRANSLVEGFASTFQRSALSVLTLFSSIVTIKVLSNTSMSGNFVTYSSVLSLVILLISLIYMLISRSDTLGQKKRYESSYKNFKLRYTDLLNEDDINKILNDDKEFKEDVIFIGRKIKIYTILWAAVLVLVFILIGMFFVNEKIAEISSVMENYPNV